VQTENGIPERPTPDPRKLRRSTASIQHGNLEILRTPVVILNGAVLGAVKDLGHRLRFESRIEHVLAVEILHCA
jgi:hypothetical protein